MPPITDNRANQGPPFGLCATSVTADMTLTASDRSAFTDLVHREGARVDDRQFDAVAKLSPPQLS
jgi:hypothetical protein